MMSRSTVVFVGIGALSGALVLGSSLEGCRNDMGGVGGFGGAGGGSSSSGVPSTSTGSDSGPMATLVTIPQVTDPTAPGHVGAKTPVLLKGVIATTSKFLVSKGSSGSCLWGVFVTAPGLTETGPNTGLLALGNGSPAQAKDGGKSFCPVIQAGQHAGDAFPDDTKPGDVFDIVGMTDAFVSATCSAADAGAGSSHVAQIQISNVTKATKTGTAPLPKPHVFTASDVATVVAGSDTNFLGQWGGVRVEVDNVSGVPVQGALLDTFGAFVLDDGLKISDKLYYVGYVKSTDACHSGPQFPTLMPAFKSITGIVYLDFCTWSLVPSDKCHDLSPPSEDCAAVADAGPDAGAGMVCMY